MHPFDPTTNELQNTAIHHNTPQHIVAHCNTLQRRHALQHTANALQRTATHYKTLQHTAANGSTLQHTTMQAIWSDY